MTGDEQTFIAKIVLGALIAAFAPQIMRFMYRIGYRDWREKPPPDTPKDTDTTR